MRKSTHDMMIAGAVGLGALCYTGAAYAQDACLDARVTASDPGVFESFGFSVAVWGETALIGAHWDRELGTEAGAAYIFRPDGTTWVETQKLLSSDEQPGDEFAHSLAMDGNVGVIAALQHVHDGAPGTGSVYVFRFDPDTSGWIEEEELLASSGTWGDGFGISVSLSGDVALIGASSDDDAGTNFGASYVFRYDSKSETWVEEQKLLAPNGGWVFGGSVAIDGDLAVIGAPMHVNDGLTLGAAYVFRFNGSTWVEEQELVPSKDAGSAAFGSSVSISGDAILVGAHSEGNGSAYVFRFDPSGEPGSQWVQEQKLLPSDPGGTDQFGRAAALDGDTAVIGAWSWSSYPGGPSIGRAYIFQFDGSTWVEQLQLPPEPNAWTNFFGFSVALDGQTALIGAHGEDQQRGAAYVFDVAINCNCPHDLDLDGSVGASDLLSLLASWGPCKGCPADFDGSGNVGASDLLALLANWGACP